MKTVILTDKSTADDLLKQGGSEEVVVVRDGHAIALVVPFDDDDADWYARERDPAFLESIALARRQIAAGQTIGHDDLKKRARNRVGSLFLSPHLFKILNHLTPIAQCRKIRLVVCHCCRSHPDLPVQFPGLLQQPHASPPKPGSREKINRRFDDPQSGNRPPNQVGGPEPACDCPHQTIRMPPQIGLLHSSELADARFVQCVPVMFFRHVLHNPLQQRRVGWGKFIIRQARRPDPHQLLARMRMRLPRDDLA